MPTKEDIICDLNGTSDGFQTTYSWNEVLKAMDFFAKQESFSFVKFRDEYLQTERMNYAITIRKKGVFSWVHTSDEKIWEQYLKGEQLQSKNPL